MNARIKWLNWFFAIVWLTRILLASYAIAITIPQIGLEEPHIYVDYVGYTLIYYSIPISIVYLYFFLPLRKNMVDHRIYVFYLFMLSWIVDLLCIIMSRFLTH